MPRFPRTSPTTQSLSTRVFSGLSARAKARAERGEVVHRLSVGDTYREPLLCARAESQTVTDRPGLHRYAPPRGEPELLEAVQARLTEIDVEHAPPVEQIQVVSGATSGLSVVIQALIDTGDEVILPSPFWPLIRGIIAARGATPVQVPMMHEGLVPGELSPELIESRLEAVVTPRTSAIYVNSPHNPTGTILSADQLAAFVRVAERHDLWILSDEAYQDFVFTGQAPSLWRDPIAKSRTIAVHTLSKSYGIAGSRIGYIHGPKSAMDAIAGVQTFSTYCAPRPLQFGAASVLLNGQAWLAEGVAEYAKTAKRAAEAFQVNAPPGGTFLFVDVSRWMKVGEADCLPFLERALDHGVLMTPGHACGSHFHSFVRVCFTGVSPGDLDDALERIRPLLESD